MLTYDFVVIGAGVVGINIALRLKQQYTDASIVVLDKEERCGLHASGRNSGVLHAGFYYTSNSLKARLCRQGNRLLTAYCEEKRIPLNKCGKLVVARNESECKVLDLLLQRGKDNGVNLELISDKEAREIEPRVLTHERAIYSPSTSSVDPKAVMAAFVDDVKRNGIEVHNSVRYIKRLHDGILTSVGKYQAGYVVNAAGLYADKIAMDYGFSKHYRMLPFKGVYLYSNEPAGSIRTNIYPVPDLRNPFLGVHFTVTSNGNAKIGPTAIPALWLEQYQGMSRFNLGEMAEIVARQVPLVFFSKFDFKKLALEEVKKYSRRYMVSQAAQLLSGVSATHYKKWGPPGIRAQLLDLRTKALEMDFVIEGDRHSLHVLNAVSPAFTCSIPFSEYVVEKLDRWLHEGVQV